MISLLNYTFSPPQFLTFSTQLPLYTDHKSVNGYFSILKVKSAGFRGGETALSFTLKIKQSNEVLILCKAIDCSTNVTKTGDVFSLFRAMGLGERETEAVLARNPVIGRLSVESIRSRVTGLISVGLSEFILSRLIYKYPDVLTVEEIGLLIDFIHNDLGNKIESLRIERLLMGTEPRFIGGFGKKVEILLQYGISEEKIVHILNEVNLSKAICMRSNEEIERMLTYLSRFNAVGIIARRPTILHIDLDTQLVPRISFLQRLSGGDTDSVGEVLNRLPAIVSYSVEHLESQVEFFRSFIGLTDHEIFKIVLVFPNIMSTSIERKLRPRVEFLKECGFDKGEIYRFLIKAALFLGLSFKANLSLKLAMLIKIGYAPRTKDLANAFGAVTRTRSEYLQEVIALFLSYGFSCEDIVAMSKKHFPILQYNPSSLKEKMEYLTEEMDREIGELLSFPAFLGYNLDNRIKPRYELKKKVIGEDMSLNKLLSVSSKKFSKTKKKLIQGSNNKNEMDIEIVVD